MGPGVLEPCRGEPVTSTVRGRRCWRVKVVRFGPGTPSPRFRRLALGGGGAAVAGFRLEGGEEGRTAAVRGGAGFWRGQASLADRCNGLCPPSPLSVSSPPAGLPHTSAVAGVDTVSPLAWLTPRLARTLKRWWLLWGNVAGFVPVTHQRLLRSRGGTVRTCRALAGTTHALTG